MIFSVIQKFGVSDKQRLEKLQYFQQQRNVIGAALIAPIIIDAIYSSLISLVDLNSPLKNDKFLK